MNYTDRDKYGMYKGYGGGNAGPGPALMGADTLLGEDVVNGAGESLGDIKEIMLDMNGGKVAYAVLAFGGFLGMGEKLFAVPWQALRLDTANKRFVLDMDKERLNDAPGFDKNAWPDMSDMQWARKIDSFYGIDPSRAGGAGMGSTVSGMGGMSGMGQGAGMGGMGAGHGGSADAGTGAGMAGGVGASTDPRAGGLGNDSDPGRVRGSNIG